MYRMNKYNAKKGDFETIYTISQNLDIYAVTNKFTNLLDL